MSDFLTRFEFLKRIAENDTELLAILESERTALENKKKDLEKQKADLIALKSSKETKSQQLQIASSRQKDLVKELEQQKEAYEKMLNDFKEQSEIIAATIRRMQSTGKSNLGSVANTGSISSYFAIRLPYSPYNQKEEFHTGIDIAAPMVLE